MCGIIAYIGSRPCRGILLEGLKRLEYRGYDSAGVAINRTAGDGTTAVCKAVGRVAKLEAKLEAEYPDLDGTLGLAHTRWATHGSVTDPNAHPHTDDSRQICLVHNGIIENYASLKRLLEEKGRVFKTETDSEVLATLISELYDPDGGTDLEAAVQGALREVTGAYAIAVIATSGVGIVVGLPSLSSEGRTVPVTLWRAFTVLPLPSVDMTVIGPVAATWRRFWQLSAARRCGATATAASASRANTCPPKMPPTPLQRGSRRVATRAERAAVVMRPNTSDISTPVNDSPTHVTWN